MAACHKGGAMRSPSPIVLAALCVIAPLACSDAPVGPVTPPADVPAADLGAPGDAPDDAPVAVDRPLPVDLPLAVDRPAVLDAPRPPLDAGPAVGAGCARDADCADGWCADLPGGYCSRPRCDMAGCPAGSECTYLVRSGQPSINVCLRGCAGDGDCRVAEGYGCDRGRCVQVRRDAGAPVDTGRRCSSTLGRDCPAGQACSASGQCTTACSFDWRCNGGCCNAGRCAAGDELRACGTSSASSWRCGDCSAGCTAGAACRAATGGGACACSSCQPIGGSCSVASQCCSRSCAGLNGNLRCQ